MLEDYWQIQANQNTVNKWEKICYKSSDLTDHIPDILLLVMVSSQLSWLPTAIIICQEKENIFTFIYCYYYFFRWMEAK